MQSAIANRKSAIPYPGSKSGSGVAHRIIGQMPPHVFYVEAFLGMGAILRAKRPAPGGSVGIDVDAGVIGKWSLVTGHWSLVKRGGQPADNVELIVGDALTVLRRLPVLQCRDTLLYCDPPYLAAVRTKKRLYRHEFRTAEQHKRLLMLLIGLPCMVMISGYPSALYAEWLEQRPGWRCVDYPTMTRGGLRTERLWMNFPTPAVLHDPRFGGDGYRERFRVTRKKRRWAAKFAAMPAWERQLVREALEAVESGQGEGETGRGGEAEPASPIAALAVAIVRNGGAVRSVESGDVPDRLMRHVSRSPRAQASEMAVR